MRVFHGAAPFPSEVEVFTRLLVSSTHARGMETARRAEGFSAECLFPEHEVFRVYGFLNPEVFLNGLSFLYLPRFSQRMLVSLDEKFEVFDP